MPSMPLGGETTPAVCGPPRRLKSESETRGGNTGDYNAGGYDTASSPLQDIGALRDTIRQAHLDAPKYPRLESLSTNPSSLHNIQTLQGLASKLHSG